MVLIDISLEIAEDMPSGGDKPRIYQKKTIEATGFATSWICLSSHTGTHVDAQSHCIPGGDSVSSILLSKLIGECIVVDCTRRKKAIQPEDIDKWNVKIVLFKTRNSNLWKKKEFDKNYVYVSEKACEKIAKCGYTTVGIDYTGIGDYTNPKPAHDILLKNNIVIFEGLDLSRVSPGKYRFMGLPLKIKNCDAAPARAVLETL